MPRGTLSHPGKWPNSRTWLSHSSRFSAISVGFPPWVYFVGVFRGGNSLAKSSVRVDSVFITENRRSSFSCRAWRHRVCVSCRLLVCGSLSLSLVWQVSALLGAILVCRRTATLLLQRPFLGVAWSETNKGGIVDFSKIFWDIRSSSAVEASSINLTIGSVITHYHEALKIFLI